MEQFKNLTTETIMSNASDKSKKYVYDLYFTITSHTKERLSRLQKVSVNYNIDNIILLSIRTKISTQQSAWCCQS